MFEATRFALQSPTRVFSDGRKEKAVAPKPAADDEAFSGVTAVPPDPVFFVSQQYKECTACFYIKNKSPLEIKQYLEQKFDLASDAEGSGPEPQPVTQ